MSAVLIPSLKSMQLQDITNQSATSILQIDIIPIPDIIPITLQVVLQNLLHRTYLYSGIKDSLYE